MGEETGFPLTKLIEVFGPIVFVYNNVLVGLRVNLEDPGHSHMEAAQWSKHGIACCLCPNFQDGSIQSGKENYQRPRQYIHVDEY